MNIDAKKEFNTEVLVIGGGPAASLAIMENCTPRSLDVQKLRKTLKERGVRL